MTLCPDCKHVHQGMDSCQFPVWTTLAKHALAGNMPCQCKTTMYPIRFGFKFNLTSFWIGVHYSKRERRTCINLLPMVTFWITQRGGKIP